VPYLRGPLRAREGKFVFKYFLLRHAGRGQKWKPVAPPRLTACCLILSAASKNAAARGDDAGNGPPSPRPCPLMRHEPATSCA
jgi:hypothetical protein